MTAAKSDIINEGVKIPEYICFETEVSVDFLIGNKQSSKEIRFYLNVWLSLKEIGVYYTDSSFFFYNFSKARECEKEHFKSILNEAGGFVLEHAHEPFYMNGNITTGMPSGYVLGKLFHHFTSMYFDVDEEGEKKAFSWILQPDAWIIYRTWGGHDKLVYNLPDSNIYGPFKF